MAEWNPRYALYAQAHGWTPDEMLERDTKRWPGGKMVGYMIWIREKWTAWDILAGNRNQEGGSLVEGGIKHGLKDHDSFDWWLATGEFRKP